MKPPQEEVASGVANVPSAGCGSNDAASTGGAAPAAPPVPAADSRVYSASSTKDPAKIKRPISEKKLASNRANGKKSRGPTSAAGKARSSKNAYKHGLCAQHLFRQGPQGVQDRQAYEDLSTRVREHYQPQNVMEEFLVEKIVTDMVRYSRVLGYENQILGQKGSFYLGATDKILRYATSNERQLMHSMKELERMREVRQAASGRSEDIEGEVSDLPNQGGPIANEEASWECLGSITWFAESAHETVGAQGPSQSNSEATPTESCPNDKGAA